MSIFVSYARDDRAVVEMLHHDLERTRVDVWLDDELSGGQAWWDVILHQIRTCELFVFALSSSSLKSKACQSELTYALALERPVLAVMVDRVSVQLAPRAIADSQIVDYTERTPESAVALVTSVLGRQEPPQLPDPMPPEPPTPMSYLNPFREQISARDLSYPEQSQLVIALRGHLHDDDSRETARQLLSDLRRRPDIVESVGRDIDQLLADPSAASAATTTEAASPASPASPASSGSSGPAAGWYPDPTGRFEQRFFDGDSWTEHVASAAGQTTDPVTQAAPAAQFVASDRAAVFAAPSADQGSRTDSGAGPAARTPAVAGPSGANEQSAFSGGVFALLIIATVLIGIIGVIVGAINLKHAARKSQAQVLLWVGIGMIVLSLLLLGGG